MGCGKSKHDVASGYTVLQRKKSSVSIKEGQQNGTETKDKNNNNADNVSSEVQVEQEIESVKKFGVEGKNYEVNDDVKSEAEKTDVQEDKEAESGEVKTQETIAAEGQFETSEGDKEDSLKENEQKVHDADTASVTEEKTQAENGKEEISVNEEDIKVTNITTSEGEEKDLKAEEGQQRIQQNEKTI